MRAVNKVRLLDLPGRHHIVVVVLVIADHVTVLQDTAHFYAGQREYNVIHFLVIDPENN